MASFLRLLILIPFFSTALLAQYVGPVEFGIGAKTAQMGGRPSDMVGKTPSVAATSNVKCFFANQRAAIRVRGAFDNWGNQHLMWTIDDRCEVKRMAGTVGFMLFSSDQKSQTTGYVCLEAGLARWSIDSTYPPLAKQYFSKPAGALILGVESIDRGLFFELGLDYSYWGKERANKSIIPTTDPKLNSRPVVGTVGAIFIALGVKCLARAQGTFLQSPAGRLQTI